MNLIIKFIHFALVLGIWAAGPASAQPLAYRDGGNWIRAERGSEPRLLSLRSGTHTCHASVGRRAVLQLTASADAGAFLRARQLRALPGPGARGCEPASDVLASDSRSCRSALPALNSRLRLYLVESAR